MEGIWNSDRIQTVSTILEQYSPYITKGHRIRLGQEGDEFSPYKGVGDAPCGEIVSLVRNEDVVEFTVKLDGSEQLVNCNNRTVDPAMVWEIEPDFIPTFRGELEKTLSVQGASPPKEPEFIVDEAVDLRFTGVHDRLDRVEEVRDGFQKTMADTIQCISLDLLSLSEGRPLEFAHIYRRGYESKVETTSTEFRGSPKKHLSDRFQGEKFAFEPEPLTYETGSLRSGPVTP